MRRRIPGPSRRRRPHATGRHRMNSHSTAHNNPGEIPMYAVRYDRFAGVDELYIAEIREPIPAEDEVVIQVEAATLNPGSLPALHGAPFIPNRDLAGTVIAVGANVSNFNVGDEVLG